MLGKSKISQNSDWLPDNHSASFWTLMLQGVNFGIINCDVTLIFSQNPMTQCNAIGAPVCNTNFFRRWFADLDFKPCHWPDTGGNFIQWLCQISGPNQCTWSGHRFFYTFFKILEKGTYSTVGTQIVSSLYEIHILHE